MQKNICSDKTLIADLINSAEICRIAFAKNNTPYMLPFSFGFDGEAIYLHTALAGKKYSFIEANKNVCFEFEQNVKLIKNNELACKWGFQFESVIGEGEISELITESEKIKGLNYIMKHYSNKEWEFSAKSLQKVRILKVKIKNATLKKLLEI